jgi:hypothetical protein
MLNRKNTNTILVQRELRPPPEAVILSKGAYKEKPFSALRCYSLFASSCRLKTRFQLHAESKKPWHFVPWLFFVARERIELSTS